MEIKTSNSESSACLGFRFSPIEEKWMQKACEEAGKFMQYYGRGRKPYMVDFSHYLSHKAQCKSNADVGGNAKTGK